MRSAYKLGRRTFVTAVAAAVALGAAGCSPAQQAQPSASAGGATTTVTVAGVAVPVPTLGQWGLVLLAGLLAAFGLRGSGRRTD